MDDESIGSKSIPPSRGSHYSGSMKRNKTPQYKGDKLDSMSPFEASPQPDVFDIEALLLQKEKLTSRNKQLSKLVKVFVMSIPLFESEFDTGPLSHLLHEKLKTHFKCSEIKELIENWHTEQSKKERNVKLGKKTLKNTTKRLRKRIQELEGQILHIQTLYQQEQVISRKLLGKNESLKEEKDQMEIEMELQKEHMHQLKSSLTKQIQGLTQQLQKAQQQHQEEEEEEKDGEEMYGEWDDSVSPPPIHIQKDIRVAVTPTSPSSPIHTPEPSYSPVSMDRRLELIRRKHQDTMDALRHRYHSEMEELHHLIDQHEQREMSLQQQADRLRGDYKVLQDSHIIKDCRIKDMSDRIAKLTHLLDQEQKNKAMIKTAFQRYQINGDIDDLDFNTIFQRLGNQRSIDLTNDFLTIQQPKSNVVTAVLHNTNHNNNVFQRANTSASTTRIPRLRSRQDTSRMLSSSMLQSTYESAMDSESQHSASTASFLQHGSFLPRYGRTKHTTNAIHYLVDANPKKLVKRKRKQPRMKSAPHSHKLPKRHRPFRAS